jgi:hypothetical protein
MALSSGTLDRLAEHFKLYLQGILLGVLKLRKDDPEERVYCLTVSGEELSIGNERNIRMEGVASEHLTYLQKKVTDALDRIKTHAQCAGMVALYDFYTKCVYPPAKVKNEKNEEFLAAGFCNILCTILGEEARKAMKKKAAVAGVDTTDLIARMKGTEDEDRWENFDTLDIWTEEIEGSETDVYENEVGKSHMPKRILKREFFQVGWLEDLFKPEEEVLDEEDEEGIPPEPRGFRPYKVAIDGKSRGPFDWRGLCELASKGKLASSTKVWRKPMSAWQKAGEIEELLPLLASDEPLLTDDDEPPLE